MQIPLKIAVRNSPLPPPFEDAIRERVDKLEQFFERIVSCRVRVEGPGGHHRGGWYRVRVVVGVPGTEIVVSHQSETDLHAAIREAFNAVDRRVEDYARRLRGDVKMRAHVGKAS